jgi:hypothetical protein
MMTADAGIDMGRLYVIENVIKGPG